MAGGKVVEAHRHRARARQTLAQVRTDVSGSATDENVLLHGFHVDLRDHLIVWPLVTGE